MMNITSDSVWVSLDSIDWEWQWILLECAFELGDVCTLWSRGLERAVEKVSRVIDWLMLSRSSMRDFLRWRELSSLSCSSMSW